MTATGGVAHHSSLTVVDAEEIGKIHKGIGGVLFVYMSPNYI